MKLPLLLFSLTILLYSCKDDDEATTPATYTPIAQQLAGKWILHSSINNQTQSTETYPETLQESSITFEADNSLFAEVICNKARVDRVIVTESGAILIDDFTTTKLACMPVDLYNTWNPRIDGGLQDAVSVSIENGLLTMRSTSDYSLVFKRP